MPTIAPWLAALPLIYMGRGGNEQDQIFNSAFAAASAAVDADAVARDSASRVCFFLAELAAQYCHRTHDWSGAVPVSISQITQGACVSLPRVKRVLGFLNQSETIERTEIGVCILNWEKLCQLGQYDRAWIALPVADDADVLSFGAIEMQCREVTLTGEPASFV
jgi:hypothetical protein